MYQPEPVCEFRSKFTSQSYRDTTTNLTKESWLALEHEGWDALCEQRGGSDAPFGAIMSSIYRLVDGEARLALYQQTTTTH